MSYLIDMLHRMTKSATNINNEQAQCLELKFIDLSPPKPSLFLTRDSKIDSPNQIYDRIFILDSRYQLAMDELI